MQGVLLPKKREVGSKNMQGMARARDEARMGSGGIDRGLGGCRAADKIGAGMAADKEAERLRSVIAVLERELAGTQSIADLLKEERDSLRKERDELAACVREAQCITARWHDNEDSIGEVINNLERWSIRSLGDQSYSLSRLIAQKQAEALDHEASGFERDMGDSDTVNEKLMYKRVVRILRAAASDLRQQAESQP